MKKRIYVMPQSFIEDPDVPARWRIWGVLNGFFINGEKCWASNDWIGERVGIHKDTVSYAVKELEKMGLIKCERTRRTRTITQILVMPEIGLQTDLRPPQAPISDRHVDLSNRVSNSVSLKEVAKPTSFPLKAELETITEYQDEHEGREPKETKTPQNVTALRLRAWCYKKIAEEYGDTPTMNKGDYFQLVKALKKLKEPDIKLMMEDALAAGKGQTVRSVFTDRLIDVYKQENL